MFKFFRHIRLRLLYESKLSKYLLYAIGEILLVVIGILIALQVNNWNNEKQNRQEAKLTRQHIHDEFVKNQLIIEQTKEIYKNSFNASLALVDLIGLEREEVLRHNLDSLFNASMELDFYFPTSKSIDNIVQSGGMKFLESIELKNTLMGWISLMEQIRIYDQLITNWQNNQYFPYLATTASFKQMNIYNNKVFGGESRIKTDYYPMFQDIYLENILNNYLYLIQFSIELLEDLKEMQHKIIDLTNES